jgi:hypothetical protein
MRIGYLECFAGISGDMLLGALVDAGVPFDELEKAVAALNVGARLEQRKVLRGGLTGTKVDVFVGDKLADAPEEDAHSHTHDPAHGHEHTHSQAQHGHEVHAHKHTHAPHRHLSAILQIIRAAELSGTVKERACRAFQLLGEAEAAIHGVDVEKVHFHEVGAVDTIVDIVATAVGAELLGVDRWLASPLNVGSGTVKCQHGTLPVPAPATLKLLVDAPVYSAGPAMERVTPTGASVLRMLEVRYEPMPAMRVKTAGYGAGGRDTPGEPNLLRLVVGEVEEKPTAQDGEPIAIISTVIDDSNPQVLAYVSELLLEAGAWDVYRVAVQMKKGRTGVEMTVLCRPDLVAALQDILFRETTTIGLHWRLENKRSLEREFAETVTEWGAVKIKIARWPSGAVANASPEFEDCKAIAAKHRVPLKQVMRAAMEAWDETAKEIK